MNRKMSNKAFFSIAASSLMLAGTMVGCSGAAMQAHPALTSAASGKQAAAFAQKAEKALAKRDMGAAVTAAEAAVTGQPDSAAYRLLLGRAYFADGRFQSAETAFTDAMTLGNQDTRAIVSLSLVKVALGKSQEARTLLTAHTDTLPVADYGLALAVAGDAPEAVRVLGQAVQGPSVDAKMRQNFAYALALAGEWRDARLMAGQDLDPNAATQRIAGWAQTADAGAERQRVANLAGVSIRVDDEGMPARLALAAPQTDMMLAQAPEAPAEDIAPVQDSAPVAVAAIDPAPVAAPAVVAEVPLIKAPAEPARRQILAEAPRIAAQAVKPLMRRVALIKPVNDSAASPWIVQVGAFQNAAAAKDSWQRMSRTNSALAQYAVLNSSATVNGRLFHRVALKGFSDRASADALCRTIRNRGGSCFVRPGTADAKPTNWAAAAPKKREQVASASKQAQPATAQKRQQLASR